MLKNLRLQLTVLYLLSSIVLALFVGGGAYTLVRYYFQSTNDQALKVKMGVTLMGMGIPLPADLQQAVSAAGFTSGSSTSIILPTPVHNESNESDGEHTFERESVLADIYILPLNVEGTLISGISSAGLTAPVNLDAISSAEKNGSDFRTFTNQNGVPVRLFTYVASQGSSVKVFQAGRFLTAQQTVLNQLLKTMIIAGGIVTLLFGLASWLLAGRTIKPSQEAFDKQQIFIANASHELRAPLTLIHAGVELGLRKTQDPAQRELLADVLNDANYMKKLIEDLLLLSRLDAQTLKLEIEPIQLEQFIPDLTRSMSRLAENQNIGIQNELAPICILADPMRLKQVLLIVLDNALRNSPENGMIELVTNKQDSKGVIRVTDHGLGINAKDLERVFDRFYKVDDRSSQEYRGSGLGLSIARALIEAQNGTITLSSQPGEWTTVALILPLAE
jgi:signal transduction histidine kinase